MEALTVLENKISELIELVNKLKMENAALASDKEKLCEQVAFQEGSSQKDREIVDQEKELTKMAVDGLIKNINMLVEGVAE
jgi:hypothetical protein